MQVSGLYHLLLVCSLHYPSSSVSSSSSSSLSLSLSLSFSLSLSLSLPPPSLPPSLPRGASQSASPPAPARRKKRKNTRRKKRAGVRLVAPSTELQRSVAWGESAYQSRPWPADSSSSSSSRKGKGEKIQGGPEIEHNGATITQSPLINIDILLFLFHRTTLGLFEGRHVLHVTGSPASTILRSSCHQRFSLAAGFQISCSFSFEFFFLS